MNLCKINLNRSVAHLLGALILFSSVSGLAESNAKSVEKSKVTADSNYPESEDIRCEKLLSTKLSDFKATLVENCNLNKPFSSNLSRLLNEETYFYCCHVRK